MSRSKQEVFNELYTTIEAGGKLDNLLLTEAASHGIRVESVKTAVQASEEDDCDDE